MAGSWTAVGPAAIAGGQVEGMAAQNNPVSGAVTAVAAHPADANKVYVATTNGGIWKTTNGTASSPTWAALTDQQASLSIGTLRFDPTDTTNQTLVAGIGRSSDARDGGSRAGLLRTTDGGGNWSVLNANLTGKNVAAVLPRGSAIVVAVDNADAFTFTNIGIFRSTDGGTTFARLSSSSPSTFTNGLPGGRAFGLVGDPTNPAVMYCAIRDAGVNNGIYKSTDTGANWSRVSSAAMQALNTDSSASSAANIKLAVGRSGEAYAGFIGSNGRLSGLFRSGDGGANWTQLDTPSTIENGVVVGIHAGGQGALHFSIAADPADANIVYVGGDRQPSQLNASGVETGVFPNSIGANNYSGRLFRVNASLPAGSQATALTHNPSTTNNSSPHADTRAITFDAAGNLLEGDDGGLYKRSTPSGTGAWSAMVGNLQNTEIISLDYDRNDDRISAGTQDVGNIFSPASGNTWSTVVQGDGAVVNIDDSSPASSIRYRSYVYLQSFTRDTMDAAGNTTASANVQLIVNGSGGQTLQQFDAAGLQFYNPWVLNNVDPARLVIGTSRPYTSGNRGDALEPLNALNSPIRSLDYGGKQGGVSNADVLWIGADNGVWVRPSGTGSVLKSSAWTFGAVKAIRMDPNDCSRAIAVTGSAVYLTTDFGSNWANVTSGLSAGTLRSLCFLPATNVVLVGTNAGLFATSASTPAAWTEAGDLPNAPALDVRYDAADDVLVAGTLGRGAWKMSSASAQLNIATASMSGTVFVDRNTSGAVDAGEPGIARTVFIDRNNNGTLDPGETSTAANPTTGAYAFAGLVGGTYSVRQVQQAGYLQTSPAGGTALLATVATGQALAGQNLANFPITYSGSAGADTYEVSLLAGGTTEQIREALGGKSPVTYTIPKTTLAGVALGFGGGADDDSFTIDHANGSPVPASGSINVDGGVHLAGGDSLVVSGTPGNDALDIAGGAVTFGGTTTTTNLEALTVNAQAGNDSLTVSAAPTAALAFNGGLTATDQDLLNVNAGTFVFNADANLGTSHLAISAGAAGAVTFDATQHLKSLTLAGGSATLSANGARVVVLDTLVQSGTGRLDLADNALVAHAMSVAEVGTLIRTGFNQGAWNGAGVTSRSAGSGPAGVTAIGYASNADVRKTAFYGVSGLSTSDVLVKYTYAGDANLDGQVDIGDLGLLSGSWQQPSGKTWFDGDFTYDGAVNIGDLGLLSGNWQKGVGNPM